MGAASRTGIFLIGAALLLSISCEKHHLGEYPEVQRELMTVPNNPEPGPAPAWVGHGNAGEIFP